MHFWKSNIRSHELGVQEANVSVSQSTESKVISLSAGLRMDSFPGLDLWDGVMEVLKSLNTESPIQESKEKIVAKFQQNPKEEGTEMNCQAILAQAISCSNHRLVPRSRQCR